MELNYFRELSRYEKWLKNHSCYNGKIDYKYKADILKTSLTKDVNTIGFNTYVNYLDYAFDCDTFNSYDKQTLDLWLDELFQKFGACAIRESIRINNARYHKLSRLRDRVGSIISYRSFFLTLTFTNDVLKKTSEQTRRKYVTRFLKKLGNNYVGNIDFGKKNGREHYHAIIQCNEVDHKLWQYGNLDFELITLENQKSNECLSKYITKLSFHALKKTNKRQCLVYPKLKNKS